MISTGDGAEWLGIVHPQDKATRGVIVVAHTVELHGACAKITWRWMHSTRAACGRVCREAKTWTSSSTSGLSKYRCCAPGTVVRAWRPTPIVYAKLASRDEKCGSLHVPFVVLHTVRLSADMQELQTRTSGGHGSLRALRLKVRAYRAVSV